MSAPHRVKRDLGLVIASLIAFTVTIVMIYLFVEVAANQVPSPAKGFSGQTVDRQLPLLDPYEGD